MTAESNIFRRNPARTLSAVLLLLAVFFDFFSSFFLELKDGNRQMPGLYFKGKVIGPKERVSGRQDLYLHHDLKKNLSMKIKWGSAEYRIVTNSLGFKDKARRTVSPERRPGTERLLILGDSFSEGIGWPYEFTFAGFLGKQLSPGTEVLNAAVSSYSPTMYYLKLKRLLEDHSLEVDRVLVMIDMSDIQDEIIYDMDFSSTGERRPLWAADQFLKGHSLIYSYFGKKRAAKADAAAPRRAIWPTDAFLQEERGCWDGDKAIYKRWGADGLRRAGKRMEQVAELCRRHKIKLTIGVYPWPAQITGRRLSSKQVVFWREFSKRERADFVDLFPYFINENTAKNIISAYFIPDDVHWNIAGHALVASVLRKNLGK